MNRLEIGLQYGCYPIWAYDEKDNLLINDLPWELSSDRDLDDAFLEIQEIYDGLHCADESGIKYLGFSNEEDKNQFLMLIQGAIGLIRTKTGNLYHIHSSVDATKL